MASDHRAPELCAKLPQPLVSKHLRVLREVGLVEVREQGRERVYRLNAGSLKPISDREQVRALLDATPGPSRCRGAGAEGAGTDREGAGDMTAGTSSGAAVVTVQTRTLTERDGRTTMTILSEHASQSDRDAVLASGIEDGMQDALALLERVAVSLR